MLLPPQDAELFFKLHKALMFFVNQQVHALPDKIASPEEFAALSPEKRLKAREALLVKPDLIDSFVQQNPAKFAKDELAIVASWQHQVSCKFYIFRELKSHTIFLTVSDPPVAYGVIALTQPFEELAGPYLPVLTETVLLPFKDKIIYDGLLNTHRISFGAGIRRMFNESYQAAKNRLGIVTSLPIGTSPAPTPRPKAQAKKRPAPAKDAGDVLNVIVGMTDKFCRDHLNQEYAALCRALAEKLARKRPSPLVKGKPETWACGIIRTIGWMNFLDDSGNKPHMKLTAIDKALGVGESTGQGKSVLIRKMLNMRQFDWHWLLPSRMDQYSIIWTLTVNGLPMDIRRAPREAQVEAFEKGLIPYVPADRGRSIERK
jgi:hypothetical protein